MTILGRLRRNEGSCDPTRALRDERGATAVEFALVATPFFIFLFSCIEVAVLFFSSSLLDNAVADAARRIRTGEVQQASMGAAQFKQLVCDGINAFMDCDRLLVDVERFSDFNSMTNNDPIDNAGNLAVTEDFNPGAAGENVLVKVYYRFPLLFPNLSNPMANLANGDMLLSSAFAFRNEPFGDILP